MMKMPILKLSNINKKLSDFFSLKNVSLELSKGEVHVLIGENGSGKSSLINVICGAYLKDSGEIFLDGRPIDINSPIDAKKFGIVTIHQNSSLFEHFSVAENIYVDNIPYKNKSLRLIDWGKVYSDCEALFNRLGFSLNSRSIVRHLNIAQKQLVEICKAYVSNARIIIMDEPTASLTENESTIFFNIVRELKKSGVTILYTSHKLEEIKLIGDKISVIRNGELVGTENVCNMDIDNIIHLMTGMALNERYPKLNIKTGREILKVEDLCYQNVLKDISFTLNKQEILGVIGLVGSGRTKVAKCIFGSDSYDSGNIYVEGRRLPPASPSDAISAGIGYLTEDRLSDGLFKYMNIPENIAAPNLSRITNNMIIDADIERSMTETFVERLEIKGGSLNSKVAYLSGGNQQKVVLAKWIMSKSKILILDEPTKGIDIASKVDVYNVMNELVTKNVSIILISSDVEEVLGMCDRILVLFDGHVAAMLPRKGATREKIMYYATGRKS